MFSLLRIFQFLGISLFCSVCFAEYRVFLLEIKNKQTQDVRLVESTLDPQQYASYHPVQSNETLSYRQTWRCLGRTGEFQPLCPNPNGQSPAPTANP